jgi:hypothetical protein
VHAAVDGIGGAAVKGAGLDAAAEYGGDGATIGNARGIAAKVSAIGAGNATARATGAAIENLEISARCPHIEGAADAFGCRYTIHAGDLRIAPTDARTFWLDSSAIDVGAENGAIAVEGCEPQVADATAKLVIRKFAGARLAIRCAVLDHFGEAAVSWSRVGEWLLL